MRSLKSWCAFVVLCLVLAPGQLAAATKRLNGKIAFNTNRDGNEEIYVMNSDGNGLYRLTRNKAVDSSPSFSSDSKSLLFSSNRDGKYAIYQIEISH